MPVYKQIPSERSRGGLAHRLPNPEWSPWDGTLNWLTGSGMGVTPRFLVLPSSFCQTPVLGLGLGVDFTFANNNNNKKKKKKKKKNPHLNFLRRNGTMGMKFGTQT